VGIEAYINLGYDADSMMPSLELRKDITRVMRKDRPNLVITHNPVRNFNYIGGNHPDHLAIGEATLAAIYPTARNPMAVPDLLEEALEKWAVHWGYLTGRRLGEAKRHGGRARTAARKENALAA